MSKETIAEKYAKQMIQTHVIEIDNKFRLVVNEKPKWMPGFLYRAVIKQLVGIEEHL